MQMLHNWIPTKQSLNRALLFILLLAFSGLTFSPKPSFAAELVRDKESMLSLAAAIDIALKNNIGLKNAYRDRIIQKFDLRIAEDKFTPKPVLTINAKNDSVSVNRVETSTVSGGAGLAVSETIPTGAQINLSLGETLSRPDNNSSTAGRPDARCVRC